MILAGHTGIALLAYAPVAYVLADSERGSALWAGLALAVLSGIAPDVDTVVPWLLHRGFTHSPGASA
jgi:inner membrane protein